MQPVTGATIRNNRISMAFLEAVSEPLSAAGSPIALSALVGSAIAARRLRKGPRLLGQEVYKAAKSGNGGLVVAGYPTFKLAKAKLSASVPRRGYVAAAFKVLACAIGARDYVDVREIARRAIEAGMLSVVTPVPEYWMSILVDQRPDVFTRSGELTIGLASWCCPNVRRLTKKRSSSFRSAARVTGRSYERDIESLIAKRVDWLETGLELVREQYVTPIGRIDLLCKDRHNNFVIVELKNPSAKSDRVVVQITRYMGYVRTHLATSAQLVRGIIVVGQVDKNLAYAVVPIPNLEIRTFLGTPPAMVPAPGSNSFSAAPKKPPQS